MMGRLEGKVTVVTGAARGLGRAVSKAYAAEGAVVYALDHLEDEVMTLSDEDGDIRPKRMDLLQAAQVASTFAAIEAEAGRIDVLVNNAGIIFYKPLESVPVEDWDRLIGVNLRGAFLCGKAVAAGMKARRSGLILNVSSNAGIKAASMKAFIAPPSSASRGCHAPGRQSSCPMGLPSTRSRPAIPCIRR